MSRLNADIEAGLADRHQINSDEQAFLLEPEVYISKL